jgi:hypothetical protein|uniref:Uncharacterized protein n=1 Tax=Eutreptiella gymnastica TaxID=73025 RepID=A0A7S4D143_9EUGL
MTLKRERRHAPIQIQIKTLDLFSIAHRLLGLGWHERERIRWGEVRTAKMRKEKQTSLRMGWGLCIKIICPHVRKYVYRHVLGDSHTAQTTGSAIVQHQDSKKLDTCSP